MPYTIAVLCYLFDRRGRVLLLHRKKTPNQDLYSPVGGKLDQHLGESPAACAIREIQEETELAVTHADLHLTGMVSEYGYDGTGHWLMFLYEVTRPVQVQRTDFAEGRLEWHPPDSIRDLPIPQTDRLVIWPMFWRFRGRFFAAHIHCDGDQIAWQLEHPAVDHIND